MRILLIEDNHGDARLIQEMLNEAKSVPFILEWRDRLSSGLQKLAEDGADVSCWIWVCPTARGLTHMQRLNRDSQECL